tara:strand:- start:55 stop:846 length:792 start_codon:yes stop_codon:yes gene_type:complete
MKLYIDNREPKKIINLLIGLCNNEFLIEVKQLNVGDYMLCDSITDKPIVVFERKSLSDLESSIKDGRYEEQGFRLNEYDLHNHYIYYLIEGAIINYRNNNFKKTLYSSLASISYFKGFSIINSLNDIETSEIIINFTKKLIKENKKKPYYLDNSIKNTSFICELSGNTLIELGKKEEITQNYENIIKTKKNSHISKENINNIMLMQIPGISSTSAKIILDEYKTIEELIFKLRENENCLESLRSTNGRKLGKNMISNIKIFLL